MMGASMSAQSLAHQHRSMKTWSLASYVEIKALPAAHVALCVALVTVWYPAAPSRVHMPRDIVQTIISATYAEWS